MSIFQQASEFTLNLELKRILVDCVKGKYPTQFKVLQNKIVTATNTYQVPTDPMDLCNLIHDIVHGQEVSSVSVPLSRSTRSESQVSDIALYGFAKRETERLKRDPSYTDILYSYLYTMLYVGKISPQDVVFKGDTIVHIKKVDTSIPCTEENQ